MAVDESITHVENSTTGAKRRIRLSSSSAYTRHEPGVIYDPEQQGLKQRSWKLHRLPFFVWWCLVSVSLYCCILKTGGFLRMTTSHDYDANNKTTQNQENSHSHPTIANINRSQSRIVHVIQTRFMQHQPHLIELGLARLALFEAFCLPSMLAQTSQNFLWIIRVDPELDEKILGRLKEKISHRQNFILLGSNHNPEGMGREQYGFDHFLRSERNGKGSNGVVLSGNATLMREAFEKSADISTSVLLETRLDADDALHNMYVAFVQNEAEQYLERNGNDFDGVASDQRWRIWCVESHIEWHPLNPFSVAADDAEVGEEGYLLTLSDHGCPTPGLTFGFGFGSSRSSMLEGRRLKHTDIIANVDPCDDGLESKCVSRLKELSVGAIRARTATSAGMNNVITGNDDLDKRSNGLMNKDAKKQFEQQFSQQDLLWEVVGKLFSVPKSSAKDARSLIVSRSKYIAADNLKGLCTPGHSCKQAAKVLLSAMKREA